jgi:hypothetical protein
VQVFIQVNPPNIVGVVKLQKLHETSLGVMRNNIEKFGLKLRREEKVS